MEDGELKIQEFNRSNVDVSILSKNPSVAVGNYDFIVGEHRDKTPALNIFTFDNFDKLSDKQQENLLKDLKNDTLQFQQIKGEYSKLRVLPAENGKTQDLTNLHGASPNYTDSEGCITNYNMDVKGSKTNPDNDYQRFINTFDQDQLGKMIIIRGK